MRRRHTGLKRHVAVSQRKGNEKTIALDDGRIATENPDWTDADSHRFRARTKKERSMSDEHGLLQAILESPDDDVPRLVYADWLDEHGAESSERGEFIRAQIELARPGLDAPRRAALAARESDLLARNGYRWRRALPEWAQRYPFDSPSGGFRRGFVAAVHALGEGLVRDPSALWAVAPVEEVILEGCPPGAIRDLAACPWLRRLRSLTIDGELPEDSTRALADSPWLDNLTSLALYGDNLSDSAAEAFAGSSSLPRLRELTLASHGLTDSAVAALAVPRLAGLTSLSLRSQQISLAGAGILATSPLRELRTLRLDGCSIGAAGAAALAGSSVLSSLRGLGLSENRVGDQGAESIATATFASSLIELDLGSNDIGNGGVIAIANSALLANLEVLILAGENHFTDIGAQALAASPWLTRLRRLRVVYGGLGIDAPIGPEGRAALLARFGDQVLV
jgi:uncharacterized protein (TIGR02996 family)